MDTGVIIALILGVSSIVSSVVFGYVPRKRKSEIDRVKGELLAVYKDIDNLLKEEKNLMGKCGVGKKTARAGVKISKRCEPQKVKRRIEELESQVKND